VLGKVSTTSPSIWIASSFDIRNLCLREGGEFCQKSIGKRQSVRNFQTG